MEIRKTTLKDIPEILELIEKFYLKTNYVGIISFSKEQTQENLEHLINLDILKALNLTVISSDRKVKGYLCGFVVNLICSKDPVAIELQWYTDGTNYTSKKAALRLLKLYEDWCKSIGCTAVGISQIHNFDLDYSKFGYTLTEKTYYKGLTDG